MQKEINGGPGAEEKNQRALKTGAHQNIFNTVFSAEEKNFYDNFIMDPKEALTEEIKTLRIREYRMLKRIEDLKSKNKDMTISDMSKAQTENSVKITNSTTTTTQAKNTTMIIQEIEKALTGVQEALRRCIDSYNKIKDDKPEQNSTERIQIINDLPTEETEQSKTERS